MTKTTNSSRFSGRCKGNPIGKPTPGQMPRACDFTSTNGPEYARHMRDVHGAKMPPSERLKGRGFRVAPRTAGETLALGRAVDVTHNGREIRAQVWAEADPTVIGAGRGTVAFFAVDDSGATYVFALDKSHPETPARGQHIDNHGRWLAPVTVRLLPGPVADESLLDVDETVPEVKNFEMAPEKLDGAGSEILTAGVDSGRVILVSVGSPEDVPAPAPAPETVPAPMPTMTRAARKASRRELAATMRSAGLIPSGTAWRLACAGVDLATIPAILSGDAAMPEGVTV